MNLGSTLLREEAPQHAESKDLQNVKFGQQQVWRMKSAGGGRGGLGRLEDGATEEQQSNPSNLVSSRSLAQVGERFPPTPAARSLDSAKMQTSANNPASILNRPLAREYKPAHQPPLGEPRKLVTTLSPGLFESLRNNCEYKASVALLGRVQGKHPGLKTLTAWARETLHPNLTLLSLKSNNVFEITFDSPEGRLHALKQADLTCESASIFLSSWRPHFDEKKLQDTNNLDYPVWVQIADLSQVFHTEEFLREIGEQIGQVISIDCSESYKAKLFGPRIRLMVKDLHTLPQVIVVPRLDGKGTAKYTLEFSGLPHQCGRCRSREHQVRHCPRKEHIRNRVPKTNPAPHPPHSTPAQVQPPVDNEQQEAEKALSPTKHVAHDAPSTEPQAPASPHQMPSTTTEPSSSSVSPTTQQEGSNADPGLHTNELNFPKLPSAKRTTTQEAELGHTPNVPVNVDSPPHFVWRSKPPTIQPEETDPAEETKGKAVAKATNSTPITRQGYKTRRLADDFWSTLNPPNARKSARKTLQVIPFLLTNHNRESAEYLVDNKNAPHQPIAHVHIAELLAGLPWTESRTRQHVVNEVAQALNKVLIFTSKVPNPLQKWKHGCWFACWEGDSEGDHICTLYVIVQVQETKLKPRKGQNFGWRRVPNKIWERIHLHSSDIIEDSEAERTQWQQMIGSPHRHSIKPTISAGSSPNRFSVLSEEDFLTTQHHA